MLHTVNKSPFERNSLASCLRLSREGSCILLLEDGVYGALRGTFMEGRVREGLRGREVYALGADLEARGVAEGRLIEGVGVVDYAGFVALAVRCDAVQAWF